jgi:cobalt/nickel transport system permease protein
MSLREKKTVGFISTLLILIDLVAPRAFAMHIMEGYLPVSHALFWFAVCLPFWYMGFKSLKKTVAEHPKAISIIAISGAFIFVISSLKIPSVTGSCSHMTGTGLAAILFGPTAVSILGVIVLIFQALLLAHGGLTTLGANTFSMAIAGPIVSYLIYRAMSRSGAKKNVSVFLAAALGDLFTYCITALQLAVAYPAADGGVATSIVKFLGVFAPTQLPLAVIEGLLTTAIILGLENYAKNELTDIGFLGAKAEAKTAHTSKAVVALVIASALIALIPFFALGSRAEFGGSDDAGSEMITEVTGKEYEPWFEPVLEKAIGGELPGEVESLFFCLQTGIGVGIIAYIMGRFSERKRLEKGGFIKQQ